MREVLGILQNFFYQSHFGIEGHALIIAYFLFCPVSPLMDLFNSTVLVFYSTVVSTCSKSKGSNLQRSFVVLLKLMQRGCSFKKKGGNTGRRKNFLS